MDSPTLRDEVETLREENRQLREKLGLHPTEEFIWLCRDAFGFSARKARALHVLVKRGHASTELLLTKVFLTDRDAAGPEASLRVQVHAMRRSLRRYGIEIENVRTHGFRLSPENRAKVLSLLGLERA